MKYLYLSHFLNEKTPSYNNNGYFKANILSSIMDGATCNQSELTFNAHIGTHIDFPYHFDKNGKTLSDYPADFWGSSNVEVIEIENIQPDYVITKEDIKFSDNTAEVVLLKTDFGKYRGKDIYWEHNPAINSDVPEYLRDVFPNIKILGMDFISVSSIQNRNLGRETHKAFLANPKHILLLEDMKLDEVKHLNKITIAPLLYDKADGVPCCVIGEADD